MNCKKCRKPLPDDAKFCCYCGAPQEKKKMYRRDDGLYEKMIVIDGKRVPFRGKTEKEVERKMLEYKGAHEKGLLFKDVESEWENEHFKHLQHNSLSNYKSASSRAVEHFGEEYIREITPNDIDSFLKDFAGHGWAQKTVSTQLLVLNLIFQKAVTDSLIINNPVQYIKVPRNLPKSKRELPPDSEIESVKNGVQNTFGLFAYFLLYTGCRLGEALAITNKDINFEEKTISINKSVYFDGNAPHIKSPKTASGIREVPLLDKLALCIPKTKPDIPIFHDDKSELLTRRRFTTLWNKYCSETCIKSTPHQLRHGYATILFEAGISPKDAQRLLGHASLAMTMDTYTHVRASRSKDIANILNKSNL